MTFLSTLPAALMENRLRPINYSHTSACLNHRMLTLLFTIAVLTFTPGCSVFGVESVEEASYQLVQKGKQFEIRDYASHIVVETRVEAGFKDAGNVAFRKLFAYISGQNEASEKIAMTSPVIAETSSGDTGEKNRYDSTGNLPKKR